ncbi:hypothetical protein ElyMa_005842400 [Elysia marginata]|uniref:Uncharacterized protein n=1 Tax=Elysia marginata TaxID=1093978 RepID=A0AAV4FZN1_9GAST|nr:hypothetical protein ElyMa_005842400 [Elysia marginata]
MWPDSEGRRRSNEVATCLLKYIEIQSHQGVRDITMFSDICAGQNRKQFVAFALNFARTHFKLETVTHTFLEKGHTETENDLVHATIERKSRNIDICSPEQWFTVPRTARILKQPYVVHEMTSGDFIDFKGMASQVRNLTTDDSGNKISWSKVGQVMSMADDPSVLHIKTFYNGQPQRLDLNRQNRVSAGADACNVKLKLMKGMCKPGIPELKKRDLMTLCSSGQIPTAYRAFYESLPTDGDAEDSASED